MIFWLSIGLSVSCILKTKNTESLNRWDILFFLSSWQIFNLKLWQSYLADSINGDPYALAAVILILLASWYAIRRKIKLGFNFSKNDCWVVLYSLGGLALILIPLGLTAGFLKINPEFHQRPFLQIALGYFLLVAPSEELIFRGLMMNLLRKTFTDLPALFLTTLLFAGIYTHLSGNGVFPNWTYVGFAFIAGLSYGISYLESQSILVPIFIHGSVDTIWRIFLS